MPDMTSFSDTELSDEIARRAKVKSAAQKKYQEEHTIMVRCPKCNGAGFETYFDMRVAVGEDDGKRTCSLCDGKGRIEVTTD